MSSTLAQFEAIVSALLFDPTNLIFTTAVIDAGLRAALSEYTEAAPLTRETVITLPAAGREIALNGVANLTSVVDVQWPYKSTGAEVHPPHKPIGFRVWWDDAQPVLYLDPLYGDQPQANDELRLWYSAPHTILNLDGASATTMPLAHENFIVLGAVGHSLLARSIDIAEAAATQAVSTPNYAAMGGYYLKRFRLELMRLAATRTAGGSAYKYGWPIDKWDLVYRG